MLACRLYPPVLHNEILGLALLLYFSYGDTQGEILGRKKKNYVYLHGFLRCKGEKEL